MRRLLSYRRVVLQYGLLSVLLYCSSMCLAQNNALCNLDNLFEVVYSDPQGVKQILLAVTPQELASAPDSIKFDYYYLLVSVDEFLDIHSDEKLSNALKAKTLCEATHGILSSVYLEMIWVVGQEYIAKNDSLSALQVYRDGCVMSKGLYSLDSDDEATLYREMIDFVCECYNKPHIREQVVASRDVKPTPLVEKLCAYPNEDEEFLLTLFGDDTLLQSYILACEKAKKQDIEGSIHNYENILQREDLDPVSRASFNLLLCIQYLNMGRFKEAETLYLKNISDLEDTEQTDATVYRKSLSGLADLYNALHNYEEAKTYGYAAKKSYEQNSDIGPGYILCLSRNAVIANSLNNLNVALLFIETALDVENFVSMFCNMDRYAYRSTLLNNASVVYSKLGFMDEATRLIEIAISEAEERGENPCRYLYNLGNTFFAQGLFADALTLYNRAYALASLKAEKIEIGATITMLSFLIGSGVPIDIAVNVSSLLRDDITTTFMFLSAEQRANLWRHYELYLPNLNFYLYESQNESTYGCIYDNIIYEKGLLLRTANAIKSAIEASGNPQYLSAYDDMLSLRQQALSESDSNKRMQYTEEANRLDKYLTTNVSEYTSFTKTNDVGWRDIREQLGEEDIAIEFYNIPLFYLNDTIQNSTAEPRYCAVILKRGYEVPHIVPLCKEADLIGNEPENMYKKDSLYSLVWAPLEQELHGVENIYFAADREMHKIAIEYALLPNGKRMNDLYNIYRLSSTRELAVKPMTKKPSNAVLYGGLNYDLDKDGLIAECRGSDYHTNKATRSADLSNLRYGFNYLPGTMDEVEKIGDSFASAQIKYQTITGNTGTEESFRSLGNDINIIHLATHGFFWTAEEADKRNFVKFLQNANNTQRYEDKALLRSGLIFTGANIGLRGDELPDDVEDGVLTAQELSSMNLGNVDLVVLSACQSGLGETSGEGVFGLQRGFKLAGANTLLMSLWKVDDTATQMLMTEFYNNLLSGQSKVESLRNAQQYVKSQPNYDDPKYWAGFILLDAID